MLLRLLVAVCCLISMPVLADTTLTLSDQNSLDLLNPSTARLFHAEPSYGSLPIIQAEPADFIKNLKPVDSIDLFNGGSYWLYAKVRNESSNQFWVFEPYDSVMDTLHLYIYKDGIDSNGIHNNDGVEQFSSGYLYPQSHSLSYGIEFALLPDQQAEILVFIESRNYSGFPRIEIKSKSQFLSWQGIQNSLVIGCFGAIVALAFYNLFIGVWTRDKSYLYYSVYLVASLVAWAAAFNALADWFSIRSHHLLIPPFFLIIIFNILYFIHFLDLANNHAKLTRFCYGFTGFTVLACLSFPLLSPSVYMLLFQLTCAAWVTLALGCGIYRLNLGYKPARFFIAAFGVLFLGSFVSLLPSLGDSFAIKHHYLITLITQTLEMLLLSLALADRINLLRNDKDEATNKASFIDKLAMQKEQEANLKLQQALSIAEQESKRKSDFLRMVSHELRTPLHSIMSSAEQWWVTEDEESRRDLVDYISYGAARLRTQVDNLVILAETDDNNVIPSANIFQLRPVLDQLCQSARSLLHEHVVLEMVCDRDLPKTCYGDVYLIEHLVRTVLENACQYTRHGSVDFTVDWDVEEQTIEFNIIDTGCGMTREQEQLMFNDFVQVSRGLDRQSQGLGLGLTICYRLCEILSADFTIRTEVGVGTHLNIRLPVVESNVDPAAILGNQPLGRVLIVEDNLINAKVLLKIVEHLGYQGDIEMSGQEAISRLADTSYHVILMDIQMPIMDGLTATRWIRQRGINTPIVAVTANSDADIRRRCYEVGMNDLLIKPVRRADIRRVLEQQSAFHNPS